MNISKVGVIGATGLIGKPVTSELVKAGFHVSALVRSPAARADLPASIRCTIGDIENTDGLQAFMAGLDALYLNLSVKPWEKRDDFHAESQGLANILSVARHHRLKRIVYLSSLVMNYDGMNGFSWWVFKLKKQAAEMVRGSGIPWTIFYPSTFMENFQGNFRKANLILLAGRSEHKMYFIAGADFGKQVARSLQLDTAAYKGYVVQGLEGFTAEDAALEYIRHYKKAKLRIIKAPLSMLKIFGKASQTFNYGSHTIEALNRYPEKFEAHDTWKELGTPLIRLQDYASTAP